MQNGEWPFCFSPGAAEQKWGPMQAPLLVGRATPKSGPPRWLLSSPLGQPASSASPQHALEGHSLASTELLCLGALARDRPTLTLSCACLFPTGRGPGQAPRTCAQLVGCGWRLWLLTHPPLATPSQLPPPHFTNGSDRPRVTRLGTVGQGARFPPPCPCTHMSSGHGCHSLGPQRKFEV